MKSSADAIIDIDAYRRRRAQERGAPAPATMAPRVMPWCAVWVVWMPVWPLR